MLCHRLYALSRWSAFFAAIFMSVRLIRQEEYLRLLGGMILIIEFIFISFLYEKKRIIFTCGYLYLFIIGFVNFSLAPLYYDTSQLAEDSLRYIGIPNDHFSLYFTVCFVFWLCIGIFVAITRKSSNTFANINNICLVPFTKICLSKNIENTVLLIGFLFSLPLSLTKEVFAILYVPIICYFFAVFLAKGKADIQICLSAAGFGLILARFGTVRYIMVQFLLPLLIIFIMIKGQKRISRKKFVFLFISLTVLILLYGVCSEIIKLNIFYHGNYSIKEIFSDANRFFDFIYRQLYRLFGIWVHLGGNIIEHVQRNGFFYGLTYVKSISGFLGLPYISLPLISADYIQASYAQPGLLAEGYANFGIIGAILNMIVPFFISEFIFKRTVKKMSPEWLCLSIIPFTKVLLDGGSINSIIFGILSCMIAFFPFITQKKVVIKI